MNNGITKEGAVIILEPKMKLKVLMLNLIGLKKNLGNKILIGH